MYLFSKETLAFYPLAEKQLYLDAGTLPGDVLEVSSDVRNIYNAQPPIGMSLGTNSEGLPAWVEKSKAEFIENADSFRIVKIGEANNMINTKQWPGKAAIGRLKTDELAQYNIWLDYLDALETIDITNAPDINWPTPPAVQAR